MSIYSVSEDTGVEALLIELKTQPQRKAPLKDDLLWKGVFEDVFEDFMCFLNPDIDTVLDLKRGFQFMDKELEQVFPPDEDQYNPKVIDKLVKVFTLDGKEEWVLIHIEVQSKYNEDFGRRMFTYFYRIFDKYQKPISAYAILTEATKKSRSSDFKLSYLGTNLTYTFNVYKIVDQNDEDLLASTNPFSLIVLIAKAALIGKKVKKAERDIFLLDLKLKIAKELLVREMPKRKIRVLMNFLRYYIRFLDPENNGIFEKELEKIKGGSTITMGIEELLLDRAKNEGKAEGKVEGGRIKALEVAKTFKELGIAIADISKGTGLSVKEIEAL
jgi:predicted transposase/invertase (TIGR01784 family)